MLIPFTSRKTVAESTPARLLPSTNGWVAHDMEQVCGSHREQAVVHELAPEGGLRLRYRRLEQAVISEASCAAVDLELCRVQLDDVLDVEEQRFVRARFASFRRVSSWTAIMRLVDSRRRAFLLGFAGRMMSASPSVLTSSGVSFVMSSSSRIGRSMMSARLLPTVESFLIMRTSLYEGTNNSVTPIGPSGEPGEACWNVALTSSAGWDAEAAAMPLHFRSLAAGRFASMAYKGRVKRTRGSAKVPSRRCGSPHR